MCGARSTLDEAHGPAGGYRRGGVVDRARGGPGLLSEQERLAQRQVRAAGGHGRGRFVEAAGGRVVAEDESYAFDLALVRARYRAVYGPGTGSVALQLDGVPEDDLVYEFTA